MERKGSVEGMRTVRGRQEEWGEEREWRDIEVRCRGMAGKEKGEEGVYEGVIRTVYGTAKA